MKGRAELALVALLCLPLPTLAQSPTSAVAQADSRSEVAAALYAASATQAAAERLADAKIRSQRIEIDGLRERVRAGAAGLKAALTAAQEAYVKDLAKRDRAYAQEIAVFRAAVEDIAATPEGVAALARFNAGDEVGALGVLDRLRAGRDAARQKRADIESAAEGRRIATLALEARAKGKQTTAQVIARYDEVTKLDPGVHWDWVEMARLYRDAGRLPDAMRAAKGAADAARNERDRSVAFSVAADILMAQGKPRAAVENYRVSHAILERLANADPGDAQLQRDLSVSHDRIGDILLTADDRPAALESYRASLAIAERLTQVDPRNSARQHDLSISQDRIGDVLMAQGERPAALQSYRASLDIRERLANADPGNAKWQHDLSASHDNIGDVLMAQGERLAALESYRTSLAITESLVETDPGNARWQRAMIVSYVKLNEVTGDNDYAVRALNVALAMQRRGILAPSDAWMIEELQRRAGQ